MSRRLDTSWVVFTSLENDVHDRCVDLFLRPDGSYGFEEFRRDPEDAGAWTPVSYYSGRAFASEDLARAGALSSVGWLAQALDQPDSRGRTGWR